MAKKDKFADVRGREIIYLGKEGNSVSIKCFVAGIDDIAISLHAINLKDAVKQYAKINKLSVKEEKMRWVHPYDYVFCVNTKQLPSYTKNCYRKLLKILRSKRKDFCYKDVTGHSGSDSGGSVSYCPF